MDICCSADTAGEAALIANRMAETFRDLEQQKGIQVLIVIEPVRCSNPLNRTSSHPEFSWGVAFAGHLVRRASRQSWYSLAGTKIAWYEFPCNIRLTVCDVMKLEWPTTKAERNDPHRECGTGNHNLRRLRRIDTPQKALC